jgi:hypothetical protein
MSMSTHVYGFRTPDNEQFQKMSQAWWACYHAGIDIPDEVEAYFDGEEPDPAGQQVDLAGAWREWRADMQEGIEVVVSKIPSDVTVIRFVNSY